MLNSQEEDEPLDLFRGKAIVQTRMNSFPLSHIAKATTPVTVDKEKKKKRIFPFASFMPRSSQTGYECKIPHFLEASIYSRGIFFMG